MAAKTAKQSASNVTVQLPELQIRTTALTLVGDSPLVCHKFADKAKRMMLDKQMKKATQGREAKDPEQDYLDSLYEHPEGGYGFPTLAFKSAAVDACSYVQGLTKVQARGSFHVIGDLVKIEGTPRMREDMVRIAMGTSDIRHRGEFPQWRCTLDIRFNASAISLEQIVNLFNVGGFAVGVGEHRPQKDGSWGMFHVATEGE